MKPAGEKRTDSASPNTADQKRPQPRIVRAFNRRVVKLVLDNIKMAGANPFANDLIRPVELLEALKQMGKSFVAIKPESLMAEIESKFYMLPAQQIAENLAHFHRTGELKTPVSSLVRQKIYALRVILTSDSAHREWHIFEKVGTVFADREASFGVVQPLSSSECAATIAIINAVRPDEFSHEVRAYIAARCHEEGFYTVEPSKYLSLARNELLGMNLEETRRPPSAKIVQAIREKMEEIKATIERLDGVPDDFTTIQAFRILIADIAGDAAVALAGDSVTAG